MKAREYIEHKFLPWILFLDKYDTINHFNNGKEAYLMELYNHISKEFNALERYELYMFRVQFSKTMLPQGISNIITIKTPEVFSQGDCAYLFIVYNDLELIYYTVDYVMDNTFSIRKIHNKTQKIIGNTTHDFNEITKVINMDLMQF